MAKTTHDELTRRRLRERCEGELILTAKLVSSPIDSEKWSANFKWTASGEFIDSDGETDWEEIANCLAEALEIAKEHCG